MGEVCATHDLNSKLSNVILHIALLIMFPRLYYCREVNDLFALHSLGVTNFVRDVPSPPRSTFEGEGDGDGGGGASALTTSVVVRAVAAAQPR